MDDNWTDSRPIHSLMAKQSQNRVSEQTREEALKIARATQRPGQTKEQTKLIAQGIQKGIDQYKKQHKIKVRELDRQRKKLSNRQQADIKTETRERVEYRQHPLPWLLLVISWAGFAAYLYLLNA